MERERRWAILFLVLMREIASVAFRLWRWLPAYRVFLRPQPL